MPTEYDQFKNHAHITVIYIHNTDQNMRFDLFFPPGKYSLTTVYEELRKRVEQLLVNGISNTTAVSGRRSNRTMTGGEMTMQPPALIAN